MTSDLVAQVRARKLANRLAAVPWQQLDKDQQRALRGARPKPAKINVKASSGYTLIPYSSGTANTIVYSTGATGYTTGWIYYGASSGTAITVGGYDDITWAGGDSSVVTVSRDYPRRYDLPDGSSIHVDDKGNYRIEDKDAKVVYLAARNREFNPFVNAADLLSRFIDYLGTLDVRRDEVATLPLQLFVNWLVVEAAAKDGDDVPADVRPVPQHPLLLGRVAPRCLTCDAPVARDHALKGFSFCSPDHAVEYSRRIAA